MIVYGDADFEGMSSELIASLETRLTATDRASLDDLRTLLVQAGQLEQALADGSGAQNTTSLAKRLTDAIATAFVRQFLNGVSHDTSVGEIENAFAQLKAAFGNVTQSLTVKTPEGFEFYALFPEQYCATAQRWADEQTRANVLVIGIRSIGTTLSAVVAATLAQKGLQAQRITLRPGGHPFARTVELLTPLKAATAIVVDEGPGLSGSSMAGVADALAARGFRDEAISFFPGNASDPGPQASAAVRERWSKTKRYLTPLEKVLWRGESLREALMDRTTEVVGSHGVAIDDLSGGAWREHAYEKCAQWPAVVAAFERAKFKVTTHSGAALLWKFTGFGAAGSAPIAQQLETRARLGWTPTPLTTCFGFTATRWIEGERLTSADATPGVLNDIGRYIANTAGHAPSNAQAQAATQRLFHMVRHNSEELGLRPAERDYTDLVVAITAAPSYGDGRMAPHEWIWTEEGRLVKMDAHDHSCDHTIVGKQPFLWDVAGVIVEWELGPDQVESFLHALETLSLRVPADALEFYVRAYAIFRTGLMQFAAESANSDERMRLRAAADLYRARANFNLSSCRELAAT